MGFGDSMTEPSFMVGATRLPVHGSFTARPTAFPVQTSGSLSRVTSNFQLSSSMFGSNSGGLKASPPSSGGVVAFHSSAQWRAYLDASKDTDKMMVLDFTASWCRPCRSMDPVINDFSHKYTNVEFIKIDVDELHDVATKYQVVSMPTFLLMKKGNVVDKVVGADKEKLKAKIEHRLG